MIETITYADHVAHLDPMTGEGLLILPRVADDIDPLAGPVTLQAAGWDHAIRDLNQRGWEPSEDDDGGTMDVGTTADGRQVIGLYGREPVISEPSAEQAAEAWRELLAVAQVVTE
ncbi:hypothetical protein C7C45_04815 [Micromonospora arborensis]|uniref:Uncharacterized protein n=1 Tax=Micromonospora arborensis TaxID=2116518 RepID=A0A318NPE3_9ACTN|nr:hypothetical protein [Micromonospora arborensis]PYC75194.1 hypothetical protein C7C45_04815 [Micromonospora arborensis]